MAEMLLIGSVFLIFFSYFGYPLTLLLVGWVCGREVTRAEFYPSVTFIATVHNEEKRIKDKLENTLSLDYPKAKLQILVASDGSTDRTSEIVRRYSTPAIGFQFCRPHGGGREQSGPVAWKRWKPDWRGIICPV